MEYISNEKDKAPYFRLWLIFFLYTVVVAVLVQMVLLPHVFPAWHGGNGLLVGGDWLTFHQIAVDLAEEIKTTGWSAWDLRPQGQAPAGIAAAIYALTVPQPWTTIPLNAILHASAALVLLCIVEVFITNRKYALFCVLPFLLFPSAMTWYTQLHKDGFFILGCLCFLYGLIKLACLSTWESRAWEQIKALGFVFLGAVLVWIVRPYGVQLLQYMTLAISLLMTIMLIIKAHNKRISIPKATLIATLFWLIIVLLVPLTRGGIQVEIPQVTQEIPKEIPKEILKEIPKEIPKGWLGVLNYPFQVLDSMGAALGMVRDGFRYGYPDAASNIDCDKGLYSIKDIVCYLPRALEIAFLSPFPDQWFAEGSLSGNTAMRRVSALEMVIIYMTMVFLPYFIWYSRKRIETWIILIFCIGMMLCFTLVIPNVGSLYRTRYGFLMTLVALGMGGFFSLLQKKGVILVEPAKKGHN